MSKSNKPSPFSLLEKWILITGASSGIGYETAKVCSNLGANLILTGRNENRLNDCAKSLAPDSNHLVISGDLTQQNFAKELVDLCKREGNELDAIIHCAGASLTLALRSTSKEKMLNIFDTNVASPLELTRRFLKTGSSLKNDSSIVFISSVAAFKGAVGKSIYGMTKSALIGAVKSLALELSGRGIRVNCVSPGVVKTPLSKKSPYYQDPEALQTMQELHPLGLGSPEDIAYINAFLVSEASRWITGANYIVDGGLSV